jgi:hypothetical protein
MLFKKRLAPLEFNNLPIQSLKKEDSFSAVARNE